MIDQRKNIVLCADGTGNRDIKARGTNVFKIYEAIDIQGHKYDSALRPQVAFYHDGIGSSDFLPLKLLGGAFGIGFRKHVRELYTELVHVFQPGDRLYLFGFSRGAYTIRALAGMIQYCGIVHSKPEKGLEDRVGEAWKAFQQHAFQRFQTDASRRRRVMSEDPEVGAQRRERLNAIIDERLPRGEVSIEFVGVWDTVSAIGLPTQELRDIMSFLVWPVKFAALVPSQNVKHARHALSIDDERRVFHPELWHEVGTESSNDRVKQVWFAGVHSNVGGGYPKQGLSLVALDWMMAEAGRCGLRFIGQDSGSIREHQDVHSKLYNSRAGLALYYRWAPRDIMEHCKRYGIDRPKVHVSVFERIANGTDGYAPGNVPLECEVVTTEEATLASRWPQQAILTEIERYVSTSAPKGVNSLLGQVRGRVVSGVGSYYAFLATSILTALGLAYPPAWAMAAGQNWPARGLVLMASIAAGFTILLWAKRVDRALDGQFAEFWGPKREALRKLLVLPVAGAQAHAAIPEVGSHNEPHSESDNAALPTEHSRRRDRPEVEGQ